MWQNLSKSTSATPKSLYSESNEKIPVSLYVEFEEKTNLSGILVFRAVGVTTMTKQNKTIQNEIKKQNSGWNTSVLGKFFESSLLTVTKLKGIKAKRKQK